MSINARIPQKQTEVFNEKFKLMRLRLRSPPSPFYKRTKNVPKCSHRFDVVAAADRMGSTPDDDDDAAAAAVILPHKYAEGGI